MSMFCLLQKRIIEFKLSHVSIVWTPRRYVCNICGKDFARENSLSSHRSVHKGSTQCPICFVILSRKQHLKRHLNTVHGGSGEPDHDHPT
ncbi:hypothetical protein FOCC_FOCC007070 [Frankliniella occidentalis]|nr:hypothetical protein FOCC_FOCC007070 [Frankliniella occidentalis]